MPAARSLAPCSLLVALLVGAGCGQPTTSSGEPPARGAADRRDEGKGGGAAAVPPELEGILEAHNEHRARHCAPPLSWSAELAGVARRWAERLLERGCVLEHSTGPHGENLASGTPGVFSPRTVVDAWYDEVQDYDFRRPGFAAATGHFTQVVWVGTERLGCARASCPNLDLWVCNYAPAGNFEGQFGEHVLPATCRR